MATVVSVGKSNLSILLYGPDPSPPPPQKYPLIPLPEIPDTLPFADLRRAEFWLAHVSVEKVILLAKLFE
jgi:hypothetical protein